MTEAHVLRVASRRGPDSLRHELAVATALPSTVPYPRPIASGWDGDDLWVLTPRINGHPLTDAWLDADPAGEAVLLDALAASMRALHAVELPAAVAQPASWVDARPPAGGPPVEIAAMPAFIRSFLADALAVAAMTERVADAALLALDAAEDSLSYQPVATVHADLGFDNAIWDGEQVWLIDLEWCCSAPLDYELVHFLRYCAHPENGVDFEARERVAAKDHANIPRQLAVTYPELFSHPRLRDRLVVYGLAGFARGWHWRPDLWRTDPDIAGHPSHDLLAFLEGRHWLALLP